MSPPISFEDSAGRKLAREELARGYGVSVPLPPEMKVGIANIVTLWGQYEREFDTFLKMLLTAASDIPEDWLRKRFGHKRKRYIRLYRSLFADYPEVQELFRATVCPLSLQLQRNAIVHGRFQFEFNQNTGEHALTILPTDILAFFTEANSRTALRNRFTAPELDEVAKRISLYCANFVRLYGSGMDTTVSGHEALAAFFNEHHPNHIIQRLIFGLAEHTEGR